MAKPNIRFIADKKDPKLRVLFCHDCANGKFVILNTRMAKQKKTMTAHHMRLVARCVEYKREKRIGFKG